MSDNIKEKLKKIFEGKESSDTSESPKKRKTRKARKPRKICDTCGQNILENEMRNAFMFQDTYHQVRAKSYCKDHETKYSDHKCKPHWCGDCNYLMKYEIEIQKG
tara:strand:+ start:303 stop:617 length:315 start_codon:yes stop_codon:yes gene_type:complete